MNDKQTINLAKETTEQQKHKLPKVLRIAAGAAIFLGALFVPIKRGYTLIDIASAPDYFARGTPKSEFENTSSHEIFKGIAASFALPASFLVSSKVCDGIEAIWNKLDSKASGVQL